MEINTIIHGDCFDVIKSYPDNFFDSIVTDPPYGIGLDKWDVKVDIPLFTLEVNRLLNEGFYCFFGQMPTVIDWINEAHKSLKYREQIIWVKRRSSNSILKIHRLHENIYIYSKQKTKFYKTKGQYTDIKTPLLFTECLSFDTVRKIADEVKRYIKTGKITPIIDQAKKENNNYKYYKTMDSVRYDPNKQYNFTNVWSFLPESKKSFQIGGKPQLHPTQKPLELMKRLIELTTPENGIVLDPFAGSFTTAIACLETGRKYVCIEKEKDYFEIGKNRIEQWHLDKTNEANKDTQLQLDVL